MTGFNVPFELGYATTFKNDSLPRHFGIGAIVDRSTYSDAVYDQEGGQRVLTGLGGAERFGRTAAYQRFDQMIYRPDAISPRGISVFGLATQGTGGCQIENFELEAGVIDLGPFESRPLDAINFAVSTQRYSDIGIRTSASPVSAPRISPRASARATSPAKRPFSN